MDSKQNYGLLVAADTLVNEDPSIQIAVGDEIIEKEAPMPWLEKLPNELLFADVFAA